MEDYSKPEPEQLTQQLIDDADVVVCLNKIVFDECQGVVKLPEDTIVWNVTDIGEFGRIAESDADRLRLSREVFEEISANVDALAATLGAPDNQS